MIIKKRYVTLIELLIVIAVLAMALGVIGFNIHKALREQRFKSEVDVVVDYLRLAQNLMLIMNADTHVIFKAAENEKANIMTLKVDGNISDPLLKLVTENPKQLNDIYLIEFYDQNKTHNEPGVVDVKFISKGSVMSKGVMHLSTNEKSDTAGAIERFICLPGYPKPIESTIKEGDDPSCNDQKQVDFDLRLITYTVQEINAKQSNASQVPAS
jgi:type II secretory pathway pseudopilin PulG